MNRRTYWSILALALVCLSAGFLTSCSSSSSSTPPPPTIAITAASGSGQTTTVGTAFANPLVANVTSGGAAAANVTVTFSAPATGASCALSSATATTDASGNAQVTCTANSTADDGSSYTVQATTSGATTPANFTLTNTAVPGSTFVYYLSGSEVANANNGDVTNYYAVAGAVTFNSTTGVVVGGEQDYNDGFGITTSDTINPTGSGFSSSVMTTGQGTLTLVMNADTFVGNAGTEIFAVQFVNSSHALITQFDGTATSSGSMDLQSATHTNGNFAFTLSGVDEAYYPVGYGGVLNVAQGTGVMTGTADVNDAGPPTIAMGLAITGTADGTDGYGRGTTTGFTVGSDPGTVLTLVYYVVGPEVVRIIDMDAGGVTGNGGAAVGSAYGQGSSTTFNNASLGPSVLALQNNSFGSLYATLGQFATSNTSTDPANLAGVGDDNEPDITTPILLLASPFGGAYSLQASGINGYGGATGIEGLGDVTTLGVYATDPTLNLMDPNNTSPGQGALVLDLDSILAGGTGVVVPQTDTAVADFAGSYGAGWQEFNNFFGNCPFGCELDMVSAGSMTATTGPLSLTGMDSDPFGSLNATSTPAESSGDTFSSTPLADTTNVGRYSMLSSNTTPNPLAATINTNETGNFNVDIYQASGTQLFWIEVDNAGVALGPLEQQGAAVRKGLKANWKPAAVKAQVKGKR